MEPNRLTFHLDTESGTPIYRQIIQQIEYALLAGRLKPGDKLPTIRALSVDLKTNPNTIAKAYNELEIRGILVTQVGSGTYISNKPLPRNSDRERQTKIQGLVSRFLVGMKELGVTKEEIVGLVKEYEEY